MQLWGSLSILWDWMKTDFFQSCGHCWVFQICWHIECNTFTASSFRIWNSSTGIPSPPLALLWRPTWLHIPGCLARGEWSHHCDYLGREDLFVQFFWVCLPPLLNIFCFMGKKCKKAKWLSGKALQIAVKRREVKSKGEKERYTHLNCRVPKNNKER